MAEPAEDDETWLYGDNVKEERGAAEPEEVTPAPAEADVPVEHVERKETSDREAGELSGEEAENKRSQEDEEEEDSDDDDVQVTIGDIKPQTYDTATKFKTGYQRPAAQGSASITKTQPKGVDIDSQGAINGVPVYEFDIESLQADEKPWRKPGADITDYFNYGFTEETWTKYCERQRRLRLENNSSILGTRNVYIPANPPAKRPDHAPKVTEVTESATNEFGSTDFRKAGPPPLRKTAGTIDVIGSTTSDSRRPARDFREEVVSSAEAQDYKKYPSVPSIAAPVPDHELPPVNVPPPDFSTPPPGIPGAGPMPVPGVPIGIGPPPIGLPPTGIPPPNLSAPPPGFPPPPVPNDPYESFYPPGHGPPPSDRGPVPGYDNRDPYGYGPPGPYGGMPNQGPPAWDRGPGGPGDGYNRNWDYRPHGEEEFNRDHYRRDRDRSRSRERERRHRDRDRERSDRDRDRDRDRGDRPDRDRDREDRHRSRRKRDEDEDHHKSKHKKSKRSKRDREEENAAGSGTGGAGGGEGGSSQTDDTQQ